MSEEIENQEQEFIETEVDTTPEEGLYGYTVDYNIYKLNAANYNDAFEIIKNLEPTMDNFLTQQPEGMMLITKELFQVDNTNILEKLQ
jgi:hypothetical protein